MEDIAEKRPMPPEAALLGSETVLGEALPGSAGNESYPSEASDISHSPGESVPPPLRTFASFAAATCAGDPKSF